MREEACKLPEHKHLNGPFGTHYHCKGCGCAIGEPGLCGECACEDDGL